MGGGSDRHCGAGGDGWAWHVRLSITRSYQLSHLSTPPRASPPHLLLSHSHTCHCYIWRYHTCYRYTSGYHNLSMIHLSSGIDTSVATEHLLRYICDCHNLLTITGTPVAFYRHICHCHTCRLLPTHLFRQHTCYLYTCACHTSPHLKPH